MTTRPASHAGSWYSNDSAKLSQELDIWLGRVPNTIEGVELPPKGARVILAP
jgi:predicted class III extradiol MEMO1 family dioxygenase